MSSLILHNRKRKRNQFEIINFSQLYQNTSELSQIYGAKASAEEQLPTVTDQLKNTNMCIVAALGSLVGALNNLSR